MHLPGRDDIIPSSPNPMGHHLQTEDQTEDYAFSDDDETEAEASSDEGEVEGVEPLSASSMDPGHSGHHIAGQMPSSRTSSPTTLWAASALLSCITGRPPASQSMNTDSN
jgi:hypothetical protein